MDPLPTTEPGAALPRWKLAGGFALIALVFLATAQFLLHLSTTEGLAAPLREKRDALLTYGADADVILVGTSRTFYGFDPIAFSQAARAGGCEWQALNLGIGMMDRAAEQIMAEALAALPARRRIVLFESLPLVLTNLVSVEHLPVGEVARYAFAAARVQENRTDLSLDILWASDRIVASSVLIELLALRGPDPMEPDWSRGGQLIAASYDLSPPAANMVVNTNSWVRPGEGARAFIELRRQEIAGPWISGLYAFPALSVSGREEVLADEAGRQGVAFFNLNSEAIRDTLMPEDWFDTWHLSRSGAAKLSSALGTELCERFGPGMGSSGDAR